MSLATGWGQARGRAAGLYCKRRFAKPSDGKVMTVRSSSWAYERKKTTPGHYDLHEEEKGTHKGGGDTSRLRAGYGNLRGTNVVGSCFTYAEKVPGIPAQKKEGAPHTLFESGSSQRQKGYFEAFGTNYEKGENQGPLHVSSGKRKDWRARLREGSKLFSGPR